MTPVAKRYGELFGANVTLQWQGQGGKVSASIITRRPDNQVGPMVRKELTLSNSLVGVSSATFDVGPERWATPEPAQDTLFDARVIVNNISVPGAPELIYDSGWQDSVYLQTGGVPGGPVLLHFPAADPQRAPTLAELGLQWTPPFDISTIDVGGFTPGYWFLVFQSPVSPSKDVLANETAGAIRRVANSGYWEILEVIAPPNIFIGGIPTGYSMQRAESMGLTLEEYAHRMWFG